MAIPLIQAKESILTPEVIKEAASYPYLWITNLRCTFPDCNGDGDAVIDLRHFRKLEDGSNEFLVDGNTNGAKTIYINDIFTTAASHPKLAQAMALILEAVQEQIEKEVEETLEDLLGENNA